MKVNFATNNFDSCRFRDGYMQIYDVQENILSENSRHESMEVQVIIVFELYRFWYIKYKRI